MAEEQIHGLMVELQRGLGHIPLGQRNTHQNYNYRGVYDVMQAANPLMAKLGIRTETRYRDLQVLPREKGVQVIAIASLTFIAPDKSSHTVEALAQGHDATDKGAYKAMAGAFKYCWFLGLCIPIGEPDDPEREASDPTPATKAAPKSKTRTPRMKGGPVAAIKACTKLAELDALLVRLKEYNAANPETAEAVREVFYNRRKELACASLKASRLAAQSGESQDV